MPSSEPVADTLIMDGAALENSKPPNASATFDDYANDVIVPYIESYAQRHSRINVVFDVYYDDNSRPPKGAIKTKLNCLDFWLIRSSQQILIL
jgi:hypothetical protein